MKASINIGDVGTNFSACLSAWATAVPKAKRETEREGDRERRLTEGEINKLQNNDKKSKRIRAMLKNKNKSKRSHQNELNDMKTNTRTHCCQGEGGSVEGELHAGTTNGLPG